MKLCRIKTDRGIRPAAVDGAGAFRDLSAFVSDIDRTQIAPDALAALNEVNLASCPLISGRLVPFLSDFGRVFCIGLNYYDHASEMGLNVPDHPILFMKACAPGGATDPIILPPGSTKTDWEVELGIVIGRSAKHISEDRATAHIAGYCVANDVSERSYQMDFGGQWVKGKSADSFAPLGPFLATTDDITDTNDLSLSLRVNGETMQNGSTSTMIFTVPQIVAHISQFLTLHPGDVILTGTPPGVGGGMTPPRFLKAGDVVEAEIAGLGVIRQDVLTG